MTNGKRILSVLLVCCMMIGLLPNVAFAANSVSAFSDVRETDWFYDDVNYVCEHQLMNGISATAFAPQVTTTRAMIVTILHRLEGTPSASDAGFSDVASGKYYADAVNWAAEHEIVNGYGNGVFGPEDTITREQMAAILYRYADYENRDVTKKADCSVFSDADQISDYAVDAMGWCNAEGLITGMGNGTLAPQGSAIRAQAAAILTRFCKNAVVYATKDEQSKETFSVTFKLNNGSDETASKVTVSDGERVSEPSNPERKGYNFKGWYTEKSNGQAFDFSTEITKDMTLYAQWTAVSTSGGSGSGSSSSVGSHSSSSNTGSGSGSGNTGSSSGSGDTGSGSGSGNTGSGSGSGDTGSGSGSGDTGSGSGSGDTGSGSGSGNTGSGSGSGDTGNGSGSSDTGSGSGSGDTGSGSGSGDTGSSTSGDGGKPVIQITNEDYNEETNTIVTQEDAVTLEGTVTSSARLSNVTVTYNSYYKSGLTAEVTGLNKWSANIKPEIGSNLVTVTAQDNNGNKSELEFAVNRVNKIIELAERVKLASEDDCNDLAENIVDCWNDNNETPEDSTDDKMVLMVKNQSSFLSKIDGHLLEPGDVYMISPNDDFVTGFTGIYDSYSGHKGTEDYPEADYPSDDFVDIVFDYPTFADIFKGDVSIDLSSGIDPDNPIAVAIGPNGEPIDIKSEESHGPLYMRAQTASNGKTDESKSQSKEPSGLTFPSINYSYKEVEGEKYFDLTSNWDKIVIYDADNDKKTTNDQITISGDFGMKNMKHTGGIELHPSFSQRIPQQIISKLSFDFDCNIKFDYKASISTGDVVKKWNTMKGLANKEFENKINMSKFSVSGVDSFKDKMIIAILGINIITPSIVPAYKLEDHVFESFIQPIVFIPVFINMDGNVTLGGTASFDLNNKVTLGFNIQENGFVGSYGTQEDNRSEDMHYPIGKKYTLDFYHSTDPKSSLSLSGKVEGSLDLGLGIGAGVMYVGLCPAMADIAVFGREKGMLEGTINLPDFDPDDAGRVSSYVGLGVKANIAAKLMAKKLKDDKEETDDGGMKFEVLEFLEIGVDPQTGIGFAVKPKKPWEHMFWERTIGTPCIKGTVFASDDDKDDSNNKKIDGASVTLIKKDTKKNYNATTDQDGCYVFENVPYGIYTIQVSKDGFDTYEEQDVEFKDSEFAKKVDVFLTASIFAGGNGTEDKPYKVSTPEQLNAVRNNLSAHYVQINDIDMSNSGNFLPIGVVMSTDTSTSNDSSENTVNTFDGSYDGGNYQISNLTILETMSNHVGLFAQCGEKSVLKNIKIVQGTVNVDKSSTDFQELWSNNMSDKIDIYVGMIAGISDGNIFNCSTSGNVNVVNCNNAYVGGIIGNGKADSCINTASIYVLSNRDAGATNNGTVLCGGITGATRSTNGAITNCVNRGAVTAISGGFLDCGGISGINGAIKECINYGNIHGEIHSYCGWTSFAYQENVGGIVGATYSDTNDKCINYGNVTARMYDGAITGNSQAYCAAGGIAGYIGYYTGGIISDGYNLGNVISDGAIGRVAGALNISSGLYSLDTATVNGVIPTEDIGVDKINGASLTKDEIDAKIKALFVN